MPTCDCQNRTLDESEEHVCSLKLPVEKEKVKEPREHDSPVRVGLLCLFYIKLADKNARWKNQVQPDEVLFFKQLTARSQQTDSTNHKNRFSSRSCS